MMRARSRARTRVHARARAMTCAALLVASLASPHARMRAASAAPAPAASASAVPTADPEAERDFARARAWWRTRTDAPFVRYGALVRYSHNGHIFDNWWDVHYRSSDGALALYRLVDVDEERHRLGGVPFSIFGVKVFDSNKDAEPIRLDEPRVDPASSFGIVTRFGKSVVPRVTASGAPVSPAPAATDDLREIGRIESSTRAYDIRLVGTETVAGSAAVHLRLVPLHDPRQNRLRDVWLDPQTYRTVQTRVQGILDGKPYDAIAWTVHYVLVDGRQYIQQIVADEPLRFGFETVIPKFEFDFVDFRFPTDVPRFTFDRPFERRF
ncbi:MAG: hypothetical protein NVS2B8_04000 [Vulcanimicrobiaceae bacterium]